MEIKKLILVLFLALTTKSNFYAQLSQSIKVDTILFNDNGSQTRIVSNLALLLPVLDSNMQSSLYWYNNYQKYGYDHSGILRRLNQKLSTKAFSDIFAITFFCINSKKEKNYSWIRVEEWHFSSASKALTAAKSLADIKQSEIYYTKPIHWLFIPCDSKIYFLSSEYFSIRSGIMETLKEIILKTFLIDESTVIEYGS